MATSRRPAAHAGGDDRRSSTRRTWPGLKVAAHAHGASGIKDAIRAGVDTIEHASLIDDEGIRMAKQHGAWLSMDIYNTDYTQAEGKKNGVLEDNLRKDREIGDIQRENFRKAHAAGAKMIFGTDAGVYPHGDNARQFAVMVRYGMTPVEAIQAATANASDALGRKDVGEIAQGRWADMIAVPGDPTQDVTAAGIGAFRDEGRRSGEGCARRRALTVAGAPVAALSRDRAQPPGPRTPGNCGIPSARTCRERYCYGS
jgi:hypothetical protein